MLRRCISILLFSLILGYVLPVLAQQQPRFEDSRAFSSFLSDVRSAPTPEAATALVDRVWESLVVYEQIPLVFPSGDVFFLYRGDAETVEWRGDFSGWQSQSVFSGRRVGSTDLWMMQMRIPIDARIEYKIVIDGSLWLLDPSNPDVTASGSGPNSELRMPQFSATDLTQLPRPNRHGALSDPLLIDSAQLGYSLSYQVYTPYNYENLADLTVFYVLDGNDFAAASKGDLPAALDQLIDNQWIEPVIAVLVSNRDPADQMVNRRESEFLENDAYANFVADELVPAVEAGYRVDTSMAGRVIMGVSYGGLAAAYITASRNDVFNQAALFSPSFWAARRLNELPLNELTPGRVFLSNGLPDWDVGDLSQSAAQLQQIGFDVLYVHTAEGHSWNTWRSLLDEMLLYFVGTDSAA